MQLAVSSWQHTRRHKTEQAQAYNQQLLAWEQLYLPRLTHVKMLSWCLEQLDAQGGKLCSR